MGSLSTNIRYWLLKFCICYIKELVQVIRQLFHLLLWCSTWHEYHDVGTSICWKRFSDGCDSQFRSRFCMVDLIKLCKWLNLEHASFDSFEATKGKNISNTTGLILKCKYARGMLKHEQGIHCVKDITSVIKLEQKTITIKFMCFLAEEFGTSESITSGDECLINGIMKLHSVVALDDKVILLLWTRTNYTVSMIYHKCKGRK